MAALVGIGRVRTRLQLSLTPRPSTAAITAGCDAPATKFSSSRGQNGDNRSKKRGRSASRRQAKRSAFVVPAHLQSSPDFFVRHVQVALRLRNARVAEHQLDDPDVDAVREQAARPFVTQVVPAQVQSLGSAPLHLTTKQSVRYALHYGVKWSPSARSVARNAGPRRAPDAHHHGTATCLRDCSARLSRSRTKTHAAESRHALSCSRSAGAKGVDHTAECHSRSRGRARVPWPTRPPGGNAPRSREPPPHKRGRVMGGLRRAFWR